MRRRKIIGTMDCDGELVNLAWGVARLGGGAERYQQRVDGVSVEITAQPLRGREPDYTVLLFIPGIGYIRASTRL